jgi:hypothetical protein
MICWTKSFAWEYCVCLLFINEIVFTFRQFVEFLNYSCVSTSYKCIIRQTNAYFSIQIHGLGLYRPGESFYRTYSPAMVSALLRFVCLFTIHKGILTLFKILLSMIFIILSIVWNMPVGPSLHSTLYRPAANHTLALLTRSSRSSFFTIYNAFIFLSIESVPLFLCSLSSTAPKPRYLCLPWSRLISHTIKHSARYNPNKPSFYHLL